ncbi:chemotaxis protein CheB [Desulfurivibrio sp. D14AmB]|uniref:chemotaxis protein CheB n=1 Tax=Desulfurivibrio sp. D14AmB TaxID=3374370 RepID=UPI00376EB4BF
MLAGRPPRFYRAVVMGVSAGGLAALRTILAELPAAFPVPLVVVQHRGPEDDGFLAHYLDQHCPLRVKDAEDKEPAVPGTVYLAPANYHLLLEDDGSFALSLEGRVKFARPSIDLLFESAADVYGAALVAIVLTGANDDGSRGLAAVKRRGGLVVVQDPATAEAVAMPEAAIKTVAVDFVLPLPAIGPLLVKLYTAARDSQRGWSNL